MLLILVQVMILKYGFILFNNTIPYYYFIFIDNIICCINSNVKDNVVFVPSKNQNKINKNYNNKGNLSGEESEVINTLKIIKYDNKRYVPLTKTNISCLDTSQFINDEVINAGINKFLTFLN